MKIKIFLTIFATVILLQFFHTNSKAEEVKSIDDVELATKDPFVDDEPLSSTTNQVAETDSQMTSNNGLLNNMRLVGTIIGENKNIAIFSAPDGDSGAFKYEEYEAITETTTLLEIYNDFVIVQDGENKLWEVDMNNKINPSEG